ncbi:response regulator [bacterium]|nr:response regulator [bacterium]
MMANNSTKTILVVDDDPDLREIFCEDLRLAGYQTLQAQSGNAALALLRVQEVDGIISDLYMSDGNGIDLIRGQFALSRTKKPFFIFVSGNSAVNSDELFATQMDALFQKPFDHKSLVQAVERALGPAKKRWPSPQARKPVELRLKLEEATPTAGFSLGKGGFFLRYASPTLLPGRELQFHIEFEKGPLSVLEGTGWVRWMRNASRSDLPNGYGIEIESLVPECLDALLHTPSTDRFSSFIPRS